MKKVKVAVIGYGHLGKWHTQKAHGHELSELVAVVEPFEAGQKAVKEAYPDLKVVSSVDEILNEIDAAIIVTPTSTHYELTKNLLQANKHVFCEKPLCSDMEQVNDLEQYIGDKILQVGHSERCHEAWDKIGDKLRSNNSSKTIKINRYAAFKGRATDVDVVQDLMIHDIDLLLYLFDEKPVSVRAYGHKIRTDKWDHVTAEFQYESGTVAYITSGRNHIHEVRSLEVMSDQGCDYVDLFTNKIFHGTNSEFENGDFVSEESYEKRDHLLIEHDHFYKSVINKTSPMVTYADGKAAIHIIEKVLNSLSEAKEVSL